MDTGVQCSKEMIDLLMKMKKHLKSKHQTTLNLSDPHLLTSLIALATVDDDVLQGMMGYVMALAGNDWSERYLNAAGKARARSATKGFVERVRAKIQEGAVAHSLGDASTASVAGATERPVRYYRGQPVYG